MNAYNKKELIIKELIISDGIKIEIRKTEDCRCRCGYLTTYFIIDNRGCVVLRCDDDGEGDGGRYACYKKFKAGVWYRFLYDDIKISLYFVRYRNKYNRYFTRLNKFFVTKDDNVIFNDTDSDDYNEHYIESDDYEYDDDDNDINKLADKPVYVN